MNHAERSPPVSRLATRIPLVLAALTACAQPVPPAFERPPAPVTVAAAAKQDVPLYLDEIGRCVARETVSVVPQVSGRITEIHFADGVDVKSGDLLFTIDPRPFQAKLQSAQATEAQAKAALALAKQEMARLEGLSDPTAVSQQDRDVRKNALDVAQAQVLQAGSAVEMAKLDLEYCSIHSPIDGRAGHRLVDAGNVVNANAGTALLVLQRMDPVYAEFTITEEDLTPVQRNMAAGKLSVEVRLPDEPDTARAGDLTFLDNAVQGTTGTVRLRATVPNADHHFWPGRFLKVRLVLNTISGAVLVPTTATQLSAKGPFVYVIQDDSTAELRPVTQGQRHGESVVIEHGLEAGEKVVIEGQIGVMPGGKVRIVEPAAPGATAAAGAPATTGTPAGSAAAPSTGAKSAPASPGAAPAKSAPATSGKADASPPKAAGGGS